MEGRRTARDPRADAAGTEGAVYEVGRDRVMRTADRLTVRAAVDMPDWRVLPHRKPVFVHAGRRWDLVAVRSAQADTIRFDLVPWPEERPDLPGRVIVYDEEYVRSRDAELRAERQGSVLALLVIPVWPLVGLLPSRWQTLVAESVGRSAAAASRASLVLEYLGALSAAVLLVISLFAGGFGTAFVPGLRGILFGGSVLALLDAGVRWSRLGEDPDEPLGAYEWLTTAQRQRRRGGRIGSRRG